MFRSKIAEILCVKVEKIEYQNGAYYIHEDICIDIDQGKLDDILSIDNDIEIRFWCNVKFKECFFKEKIFEKNIFFSVFYNTLFFKCEFKSCIPNKEENIKFDSCSFENIDNFLNFINFRSDTFIKCVYKSDFVHKGKFLPKIEIKNWTFKGKVDFKNITCNEEISFENINFDGKIDFSKSIFEKKVSFKNCTFNKLSEDDFFDFSEIDFKDNVYFDDSDFDEFVAFHLCVFEKTASFYSTKFKVIPNFSLGDFKGILNINNATWGENGNIEFEDVKKIVDKACGKIKTKKEKLEIIRNIKDFFRAIKNVLIQKNDQLEAQKFHKAELYCKELELEKENKNFSTYIDSLLLRFYRITSDHHTNFLKILNFTVLCIAVYAVCSFVFVGIYEATFLEETRFFDKEYSKKFFNYSFGFLIILTMFAILPIKLLYFFLFFCFFVIPLLIGWFYFSNFTDQDIRLLFKATIPMWISFYFCLIISSWVRLIDIPNDFSKKNFFYYLYQIISYFVKFVDYVCKLVIWCIVAFVLYLYPQLINPFVGVFKSDEILSTNYFEKKLNDLNASEIIRISNLLKNITYSNLAEVHKKIIDSNTTTNTEIINAKELIKQNLKEINIANKELNTTINDPNELNATVITVNNLNNLIEKKDLQEYLVNGIKSSSIVYSIILLLCLYSLTKTARKNSIVPI